MIRSLLKSSNFRHLDLKKTVVRKKITNSISNPSDSQFYNPIELLDKNIIFVGNEKEFSRMLIFFENTQPDVIGIDLEYKPRFKRVENPKPTFDKTNRANILQLATREKTFLVEVKHLLDRIDPEEMRKFGDLILFKKYLIKLG
jgi:hypothetical protein